ncbi:MAG: DNA polymerase IV, partial [Gammaproteobacteria bacterium]|nr:DNA polymerase IV [Gammaproteobacteria bacterium]
AYLDVSDAPYCDGSATRIAQAITGRISKELALTASAGVSYNKFLAKMASEVNKPDGLFVIAPGAGADFVATLPIGKFFGIGPATAKKLKAAGIHDGADLRGLGREQLRGLLGKAGDYYFKVARGVDDRPVVAHRIRKSLGSETTFADNITDLPRALRELRVLSDKVAAMLERARLVPRTITLKVKYADFRQVTRAASVAATPMSAREILRVVEQLLARTETGHRPVRLLGITTSNFLSAEEREQLALFD